MNTLLLLFSLYDKTRRYLIEFGNVRMVEVNGEPYAVGVDIARALEYRKPRQDLIISGIVRLY